MEEWRELPGVVLRTVGIFFAALILVRIADKRFLARKNALDGMLTFILASALARAIYDSRAFLGACAAGVALVLLHRALAWLAFRWHPLGRWIKGDAEEVVTEGRLVDDALRRHRLSKRDVEEDLRLNGVGDVAEVRSARLERSGEISVLRRGAEEGSA